MRVSDPITSWMTDGSLGSICNLSLDGDETRVAVVSEHGHVSSWNLLYRHEKAVQDPFLIQGDPRKAIFSNLGGLDIFSPHRQQHCVYQYHQAEIREQIIRVPIGPNDADEETMDIAVSRDNQILATLENGLLCLLSLNDG